MSARTQPRQCIIRGDDELRVAGTIELAQTGLGELDRVLIARGDGAVCEIRAIDVTRIDGCG